MEFEKSGVTVLRYADGTFVATGVDSTNPDCIHDALEGIAEMSVEKKVFQRNKMKADVMKKTFDVVIAKNMTGFVDGENADDQVANQTVNLELHKQAAEAIEKVAKDIGAPPPDFAVLQHRNNPKNPIKKLTSVFANIGFGKVPEAMQKHPGFGKQVSSGPAIVAEGTQAERGMEVAYSPEAFIFRPGHNG